MDFQELKDIIQRDGGKIIIVENDKAQFVVMSFEEYKRKRSQPAQSLAKPDTVAGPPESSEARFGGEREELTIDDLPI